MNIVNSGLTAIRLLLARIFRRDLSAAPSSQKCNGIVVFKLPADSPIVTTEAVRKIELGGM